MKLRSLISRSPPRSSTIRPGQPVSTPGRSGVLIVAIMKDEARHIEDWLRFHAIAGVRDFILYDDGSMDGTPRIAKEVLGLNVHVVPWRMTASFLRPSLQFSRQALAYCHAIENFGGRFRWIAFIDIDECIVPLKASTIAEALSTLEDFTNISLPWTMFGPNQHPFPPNLPAQFAFTTRAATRNGPLLNFKCIVDPCDVSQLRVHSCETYGMGTRTANDKGQTTDNRLRAKHGFATAEVLQLNHYYTRSMQELSEKLEKGAVSGAKIDKRSLAVMKKIELIERDSVEDRAAIDFLARHGIRNAESFRGRA